jgi:hypothetical protein
MAYLYVSLKVGGNERLERAAKRETEIVREKDGSIDYNRVEDTQSTKVIFESVSDENGLRINEAKQIPLNVTDCLCGLLEVLFA